MARDRIDEFGDRGRDRMVIRNSGGATLASIRSQAGSYMGATIARIAGAWTLVDLTPYD